MYASAGKALVMESWLAILCCLEIKSRIGGDKVSSSTEQSPIEERRDNCIVMISKQ